MGYTLTKVEKEFREACSNAGIELGKKIPVLINGRLTSTMGRVCYSKDEVSGHWKANKVEFSKKMLDTATNHYIHNVILHEAAHLIVFERTGDIKENHGSLFKAVCKEIGTTFNTASADFEPKEDSETHFFKYEVYCEDCHKVIAQYSRMCKTLKEIEYCSCAACGSHNLTVIQNW